MIVVIQQIYTANDCCNTTNLPQLMIVVIQQIYTANDCCNTTNLHS